MQNFEVNLIGLFMMMQGSLTHLNLKSILYFSSKYSMKLIQYITLEGLGGLTLNFAKIHTYWQLGGKGNSITLCTAITNIALIVLSFPLIIGSYMTNEYVFQNINIFEKCLYCSNISQKKSYQNQNWAQFDNYRIALTHITGVTLKIELYFIKSTRFNIFFLKCMCQIFSS